MDEGDDYVPQISQLGDYGMPMQPQQPQYPPQGMSGGMTAMSNPYEQQQHMMMMQHQNAPPQAPTAPPPKKPRASKSKKAQAAAAAAQEAAAQMDPMQSMAAMSNNPMMRPSMQQMGGMYQPSQMGMYPGQGYPGAPGGGPPGTSAASQQGYRPGPGGAAPGAGAPGAGPYPPGYSQYPPGYPQQQRPGYPPYGYPQNAYGGQYPPQMRPQYPPGQQQHPPNYWDQQGYPGYPGGPPSQQVPPGATGAPPPGASGMDQWRQQQQQQHPSQTQQPPHDMRQHMYQLEMEMSRIHNRMSALYSQQRSPMIDQEISQLQHRMQYMQAEHQRLMAQMSAAGGQIPPQQPTPHSMPSSQSVPPQQQPQQAPPHQTPSAGPSSVGPGSNSMAGGATTPSSTPSSHSQVVIQHGQPNSATPSASTPVQVTQSGSQVQVNIKPETSGRTLISVYHRYGESPRADEPTTFGSSAGSAASSTESKDSVVPPEPTPTSMHQQHQMQRQQSDASTSGSYSNGSAPAMPNGVENGANSQMPNGQPAQQVPPMASPTRAHAPPNVYDKTQYHQQMQQQQQYHQQQQQQQAPQQGMYPHHSGVANPYSHQYPGMAHPHQPGVSQHQPVHQNGAVPPNAHGHPSATTPTYPGSQGYPGASHQQGYPGQMGYPPMSQASQQFGGYQGQSVPPQQHQNISSVKPEPAEVQQREPTPVAEQPVVETRDESPATPPAFHAAAAAIAAKQEAQEQTSSFAEEPPTSTLELPPGDIATPPMVQGEPQPSYFDEAASAVSEDVEPKSEFAEEAADEPFVDDVPTTSEADISMRSDETVPAIDQKLEAEQNDEPESVVEEEDDEDDYDKASVAETQETEDVKEEAKEEPEEVDESASALAIGDEEEEEETPTEDAATAKTEDSDPTPSESNFTEPSTPATPMMFVSSTKRSVKRPAVMPKSRKKKSADDSDGDDDDFVPERSRNRKKGGGGGARRKPTVASIEDDEEFGLDEASTSMRRAASGGKWADILAEDDEEDSILTVESTATNEAPDALIVEKILNLRQNEGEEEQYLIKWKNRAYIHCEWKTAKEIEEVDKRSVAKVKRFKQKRSTAYNEDDEDFNNDYTIVDRIVDVTAEEDGEFALVKWKSLGYDEVTWEPVDTVPAEKVELWRQRQIIDKAKTKEKARPKESEWRKIPDSMVWKDGNTLREYQFEGVNWLLYCYYNQQNCILADEMGLGKTVQTITFLSQIYEYGIHGPFLIVVPLSTIHNWVREFETWTDMNAVVYHGSAHAREIIQQYEIYYSKERSGNNKQWKKNMVKLDALITTFEMVVTDCEFLRKVPWRVCVIDEAHRLKNRNCKLLVNGLHAFRMEHRVLLTGTPLQNNIEELFSLLNFLHPQQFSSSVEFLEQFGQCKSDDQVQKLQEILRPMMLRRLKEDVEKSLQPKEETIIEVQLSDAQKKFYRAILERNFTHLCKGTSAPSLMNVMMELRKCCNHPFLIQGAEETILAEMRLSHPDWDDETLAQKALVQASGKVVLIEKLLPKLRKDGHKVLIFSQMVKVLDLLEEFLVNMNYPFERIDGNVRGDLRQASIDRFSRENSDRFVFLLCTRAGGLGINLTAADTVIIFDSDWNPQNDLQAQARCHRIGQKKMVKVYRLVTTNTYEREMFEKASLKLGLDKAVLQSTTALKESSTALSKKDVEELLKKGAYGSIMDESSESSKFNEEDIDTILQRRTTTITLEAGQKGSLFSKATFNSAHNKGDDIDIDDPEFWNKWAEKAQVDIEKATATPDGRELIIQEPRKRTKRFEDNSLKEDEDSDGSEEGAKGRAKRMKDRKRRRGEDEDGDYSVSYRPDELAIHKTEYFKVEKVLAQWGWGRWSEIKKSGELEMSELDIEHMSRTLLLHCIREFRGEDRVRQHVFTLISPQGAKVPKHDSSSKGHQTSIYHQGWAALPEFNPPSFALDSSFQRHVHRHANKLMVKIDQLKHLETRILCDKKTLAENPETKWDDIELKEMPTVTEAFVDGWDADCDKCLLIGAWRYGLENYDAMKADEKLCFHTKTITAWPGTTELTLRFRKLVAASQRNVHDPVYERLRWNRREEQEYMRVLRSFGIKDKKDGDSGIDWDAFRSFSPLLERKPDEEMQEQLYCILAMCTKAQGNDLSPMDIKRAMSVDSISSRRALRLLNRLHLTRKIHALGDCKLESPHLRLCSTDAMPSGWTYQHDRELVEVCDQYGIENIAQNCLKKPSFEKIVRPSERTLLRRVLEIVNTVETGKWNGAADVDTIEDSDTEEKREAVAQAQARLAAVQAQAQSSRRGRKRGATSSNDNDAKMRALMQQLLIASTAGAGAGANPNDLTAAFLHTLMLSQLAGGASTSSSSSAAAQNTAAAQLMASLIAMSMAPGASTSGASTSKSSNTAAAAAALAAAAASSTDASTSSLPSTSASIADVLGLTAAAAAAASSPAVTKKPKVSVAKDPTMPTLTAATTTPSTSSASSSATSAATLKAAQEQQMINQLAASGVGINELVLLSQFPGETRIPVMNQKTRERKTNTNAPMLKDLTTFLLNNPDYVLDLNCQGKEATTTSTAATTSAAAAIGIADSTPSSAKPSAPPTPAPAATPTPAASVPQTPKATSPKLEPGEVPKKTPPTSLRPTSTVQVEEPVAVYNKTTGELAAASRWPKASDLAAYLDANPDVNVHSSCAVVAQIIVGNTHADRIGGEPSASTPAPTPIMTTVPSAAATPAPPLTPSTPASLTAGTSAQLAAAATPKASTSRSSAQTSAAELFAKQQIEAMQMQMMLQQAVLQQSMLLNPYLAATSTAAASTPSTSTAKQEDVMNPMVMSALMSNPLLLQSLMMTDPATAMALAAASQMPSSSGTSSSKKPKQS